TIHNLIRSERPDYLPRLYRPFAIEPPVEQRLPGKEPLWRRPVFEWDGRDLIIHYIRYLMDPGMKVAGTPLSTDELEMLKFIDSILRSDEILVQYQLKPGEILFFNNLGRFHVLPTLEGPTVGGKGPEFSRV